MNDINEQTTTDDCALLDSIKRLTEVRLTSLLQRDLDADYEDINEVIGVKRE